MARPDEDEERQLVGRAKAGDVIARNMVIAGHLWLTKKSRASFTSIDSEADDLRQEAALALFKALDDFDPKSGNRFSTFAWISVCEDVKDWLRKIRRLKRHVSTELIAGEKRGRIGALCEQFCKVWCRVQNISRAVRKNVEPLRIILMRG